MPFLLRELYRTEVRDVCTRSLSRDESSSIAPFVARATALFLLPGNSFAGSRLLFDGRLYENPVTKREHFSSTPVY